MKKNLNFRQIDIITKSLDFPMNFQQGKLRNKIFSILNPVLTAYHNERVTICEKYAEKNEKGEFKITVNEKGGQEFTFDPEKKKEFDKEFAALNAKLFEVEFPDKSLVSEIRNFINISPVEMTPIDVILLEELLGLLKSQDDKNIKQD